MTGSRLIQAPLPWLPGGAQEIAPGVGLLLCVPRMSSTALTSRVALPALRP